MITGSFKKVEKVFKPRFQKEGVGADVMRIIGVRELPRLDPFLMLDFFHVKLPAGFPDHPHRGFETVTYMLKGKFFHEDFKGHKGVIGPGDIQWMTAGKGIVHSEMPGSFEELSIGFQLWINLQKKDKLIPAGYQEYTSDKIPVVELPGKKIKVIAGETNNMKGPIVCRGTPANFFDVHLEKNQSFEQIIPGSWKTLVFIYEGEAYIGEEKTKADENSAVILKIDENDRLLVSTLDKPAKFIVLGGQALNEPIAQQGPFVMNTQDELYKAIVDYSNGENGFEGAHEWESKIRNMTQRTQYEKIIKNF
eukprot:TRINITY_DN1527_c0_g1_i5.p1 TRINITY_DN1527_c0_g1~~TRINITY_DN1527_c0_g1_i5.p1  ORF type:complete len:307 (+),score=72.05 TRINITY_DN1527_c0_g1_i5:155-1075(+)